MRRRRYTKKDQVKRRGMLFWIVASAFPLFILIIFLAFYIRKPTYISPLPFAKISSAVISVIDPTRALAQKLQQAHIQYDSVAAKGDMYIISLPEDEEIIFSKSKNLDNQISSLQLIIQRLTIEGKRIARLDFRFDNPIIVFK